MPVFVGRFSMSLVKASRPPADAPTPTMAKGRAGPGDSGAVSRPGGLGAAPAPFSPVSLAGGFFGPLTFLPLEPALLMAFLDPPDLVAAMPLPPGWRIN